ncbi:MAG: hypothetical protein WC711_02440 [Candidatus Staskawiczbacteria bacterium]|jgi:hypothetical protein
MEPNIIQDNSSQPNNTNQPVQPMMPRQKKQIPSWLGFVIITIFIVIIFGGVFAWQYFFVKVPAVVEAPQVQNETAGWKTYTDVQYGYEIKYPTDWKKIGEYSSWASPIQENVSIDVVAYSNEAGGVITNGCPGLGGTGIYSTILGRKEINGLKFCRYIEISPDMGGEKDQSVNYFTFNNDYRYLIRLSTMITDGDLSYESDIFDKMLSTFKFTK